MFGAGKLLLNNSCGLLAKSCRQCLVRSLATANTTNPSGGSAEKQLTSVIKAKSSEPATRDEDLKDIQELKSDRPSFYHDQMDFLDDRLVRISKPSKNVMQSGTASTNCWKIEFNSEPRYEYWLMGWASTNDPLSNLTLTFPTKESAISFCEKNKLQWFVEDQPERKIRRKSYADNFSWNKRTRLGSK